MAISKKLTDKDWEIVSEVECLKADVSRLRNVRDLISTAISRSTYLADTSAGELIETRLFEVEEICRRAERKKVERVREIHLKAIDEASGDYDKKSTGKRRLDR